MRCQQCGAETQVRREDWSYPPLPHVTLLGVQVRRCARDPKHQHADLSHPDSLRRVIAAALLGKRARLTGPEIRFLRDLSGWDAVGLATLLDVTPVSLSRWENDQMAHSGMADRLMRMLAADVLSLPAPRDVLRHIGDAAAPSRMALRFGQGGWRVIDEDDPVSAWVAFADDEREAVVAALEASLPALGEEPARALRVAVDMLRALRPAR